jgi:hypothetical protein
MVGRQRARDTQGQGVSEAGPNQALKQTAHATDATARHSVFSRVSRLLGLVFGGGEVERAR